MKRTSRNSRQSYASPPIQTLEHDAVAVALQEALGSRVILIRAIGEGGMGRVYLARDPQLKRFVAVKVLVQSQGVDAESHARFQREAQAIAAVSHPNVVAIYGVGELPDGCPYFVMQYVSGGSMSERLAKSGPLPIDVAESVIGDVASALAAAHRRGIIHRDVKPANVLWDEEAERATVSDFGIATLLPAEGEESDVRITGSGMAVGSPAYMSPEQLLTEPTTPKSDVYALGLLGYELLTGRGPYHAKTPSEVVAAHLRDKPRRLSEVRTDIPESLQDLLLRCLSKLPEDRPTAEEVMLAMTPGAADALEWPPPGLERLRGALWRLTFMPALATAFLLFPLLMLVTFGRSSLIGETLSVPLLLAASSLLGFAAFARGGYRTWTVSRSLFRAGQLGYGWGTVAEVMSDRRGDTGALIAGTREYAPLPATERARLRALRVLQAASLFLAPPMALFAAIVALALRGSQADGDSFFVRVVLVTLLTLGGSGILAALYERARLGASRHKRALRPRHTNEKELAPAWYAAFERSREGQPFGPGRPVSPVMALLLVSVGTLVVIFCAAVILTASMITVTGKIFSDMIGVAQTSMVPFLAQRNMGGTTYRIPPDGHTTAIEAGEALLAIQSTVTRRLPSPIEHRLSNDYPSWRMGAPPLDLFPKPHEMHWTTAAILAAEKGLSPEQRTALQQAAAHPARDEFSRAAAAAHADVFGALLKLPLKEHIHPLAYPDVALYGVNEAAESHAALVALDIADHRPADAERHAREIVSVGTLLLDLHVMSLNLTGSLILARGVGTLEAVYAAIGREREARALLDSVVAAASRADRFPLGSGAVGLERAMRNPKLPRGARMAMLVPLVLGACADPRQLLFGVDDTYRRNVTYARDSLARFPSERVWVDAVDGMLSMGGPLINGTTRSDLLAAMGEAIDQVVGGKRFESCANIQSALLLRT